jgi:hypothetical protein
VKDDVDCETIAHVIQAFAAQGTWSQAELARRTGIEPRRLCRVLLSLAESGMPLDKDEGGARASSPRVLARRHCCPHRGAHVDLSGCHRAPKTAGIRAARG